MTKLSKKQIELKDSMEKSIRDAAEKVEDAINHFNQEAAKLFSAVESAVENYNSVVSDADGFRDEISSEQTNYFDDKSEGWQDGERGQSYSIWKDQWESELSPIECPELTEIEVPEMEHGDTLESLPTSVDEA